MTFSNIIKKIGFLISILLFFYLLNPYNLNIYFGYLLAILILTKKKVVLENLDFNFVLLLIFSLVYAIFYALDPTGGSQYILVYALLPASFYLLGQYVYIKLKGDRKALWHFLLGLGVLYSCTPLISVFSNILTGGFGQLDRSLPLFWNGQLVPATIMGSYFSLNMCIPAILVIKQKKSTLLIKIIAIAIFLITLACVLRIGSRTQILVFFITLFCSLVYIVPRQSLRRNVFIFCLFFIGVSVLISNVSFDLDQDWLSTFAGRLEKGGSGDLASGGGRVDRWIKSLENIFKKPLGWDAEEFGHSHNLWLDVLRVSGVIPFFLLLLFSAKSYIEIKRAVKNNSKNHSLNLIMIVYYVAFFLVFMVEPIFEGAFEMFVIFCLLLGVVSKYRTSQPINP